MSDCFKYLRGYVITYSKFHSEIHTRCLRFQQELFCISKLAVILVYVIEIQHISDSSSHCFGHHISNIVSDVRKAFSDLFIQSSNAYKLWIRYSIETTSWVSDLPCHIFMYELCFFITILLNLFL